MAVQLIFLYELHHMYKHFKHYCIVNINCNLAVLQNFSIKNVWFFRYLKKTMLLN